MTESFTRAGPDLLQRSTLSITDTQGCNIKAHVHPWSWVYPSDGLQLMLELADGSLGYVANRAVAFAQASLDDVRQLLGVAQTMRCVACGKRAAFDPQTVQTNQNGRCYACHGLFTRHISQCHSPLV